MILAVLANRCVYKRVYSVSFFLFLLLICILIINVIILFVVIVCTNGRKGRNKKAVLSQGNHAMPQLFFGLKFADIYYKLKSSQASKARLQSSKHTGVKQVLNAKWSFKVIQGHVFWSQ